MAPTGTTNHYAEVKEGCPDQPVYDNAQENGEGVGYQQYSTDCFGLYRSFYEINTSALTGNMLIQNSTLHLKETYGADAGCGNQWSVGLNYTIGINSNTTWNGQPSTISGLGQQNVATAWGSCGPKMSPSTSRVPSPSTWAPAT